jgi:hypothetical protein
MDWAMRGKIAKRMMLTAAHTTVSRRQLLAAAIGAGGLTLAGFLEARSRAAALPVDHAGSIGGKAKSLIILYCWGGMSHIDTFDPKPAAPIEIRGEFEPIATSVPGIQFGEHMPLLANHADKLAVIRSIRHDDSAHGRGMYWMLTGHKPMRRGGISPKPTDWPSLPAMLAKLRPPPRGAPAAVRMPYPMVDNNKLQAGEYGGWLGVQYDPIIMRPPAGEPYGGVSQTLGAEVLQLGSVDVRRLRSRRELLASLDGRAIAPETRVDYDRFQTLAGDILLGSAVREAYDLDKEDPKIREMYGEHLAGQSMLLARRLTEAGAPVVQVCCAAGDLNQGQGDMWDTHGDNFNRLKKRLLPPFDRAASALLADLAQRGSLEETVVAILTDFGRTPRVNGGAGRDHYPDVYSVALAGGGIRGGQIYGESDASGAFPRTRPCGPADIHATIFTALGISPKVELPDMLGRPMPICDGRPLELF